MPREPTEIPHLAFTHHRIGIHNRSTGTEQAREATDLHSFYTELTSDDVEQKRSLGLAYVQAAEAERDVSIGAQYRDRALNLLTSAQDAGFRDPLLDAALARLYFERQQLEAPFYAESALADPGLDGLDRCNALAVLANVRAKQRRFPEALGALRQLTQARRHAVDWLLVAECEQALGNAAAAEKAMLNSVQINPRLWEVHKQLAEYYRLQGDTVKADWHQLRAKP
jgi:tetratricopeptide (TPR) repeat protein